MRPSWNQDKILVITSIGFGLIFGIFRPIFLDENAMGSLSASLQHFVASFGVHLNSFAALFDGIFRYGRSLLLIWVCAMFSKARYVTLFVLFMRAMSLSFSAAMMVAAFGGRGFGYAMMLYGLQNLLIMPVYVYSAYHIIQGRIMLKTAVVGIIAVVAASIIDAYLAPALFVLFWR
ncbi:MAG: hypothetical protein FWE34_01165 [Defluviitaleaceae bacterium]|nr:hypothetical protein [Defluviitaleaceae bacterium]